MPLFLLHEIFPQGPLGIGFIVLMLMLFIVPVIAKLLALLGALAIVGAGRDRIGPLLMRDAKRPSVRLVLTVFLVCAVAGGA